jgi:hypothetical protein
VEVVRVGSLAGRQLPQADAEPSRARLVAESRALYVEAVRAPRLVELGVVDVGHGACSTGASFRAGSLTRDVSLKKELREILREARRQGWRVRLTRGGHYKLYAPDGENIVTTGSTPSSPSSIRELLAHMRSFGFKWKGR